MLRFLKSFDEIPYLRADFTTDEIRRTWDKLHLKDKVYDFDQFAMGMNVELEHKDVTGGCPIKTAKIALAHLDEDRNYYTKLKQMEEGFKKSQGHSWLLTTVDHGLKVGESHKPSDLLKRFGNKVGDQSFPGGHDKPHRVTKVNRTKHADGTSYWEASFEPIQ